MILAEKIVQFLKKNGTQMNWFAEMIGMSKQHFYQSCMRKKTFSSKHWKIIIRLSKETISYKDCLEDFLREETCLTVLPTKDPLACLVRMEKSPSPAPTSKKELLRKENLAILEDTEA